MFHRVARSTGNYFRRKAADWPIPGGWVAVRLLSPICFVLCEVFENAFLVCDRYIINIFQAKNYERQTKAIEKKYALRAQAQHKEQAGASSLNSKDVPQWVKDDRLHDVTGVLFSDYLEMCMTLNTPEHKTRKQQQQQQNLCSLIRSSIRLHHPLRGDLSLGTPLRSAQQPC